MPLSLELKKVWRFTAISLFLALIAGFIPVFGIVLLFLSTVPAIVLFKEKRAKEGVLSMALTVMLIAAASGRAAAGSYLVLFSAYVFIFIWISGRLKKPYPVIAVTAAGWLIILMIYIVLADLITGSNLIHSFIIRMQAVSALAVGKYYEMGIPSQQIGFIEEAVRKLSAFLEMSVTGLLAILALTGSWTVYSAVSKKTAGTAAAKFTDFRMPDLFVWALIASLIMYFSGREYLSAAGINLAVLSVGLYFFAGSAVALSALNRFRVRLSVSIIFMLFAVFFLRGLYLFAAIGIADIWLDFRKRIEIKE